MSKPISSYPKAMRERVLLRRVKQLERDDGGSGCLGAMDALRHIPAASLSLELRGAASTVLKKRHDIKVVGVELR